MNRNQRDIVSFCICLRKMDYREINLGQRKCVENIRQKYGHITLRGKTYAKLRYEQNHLCNRYEMRSEPIDSDNADNAFKYYKDMNFIGNIVYLNEEPYAAAIGGEITKDTFGIQVAKMKMLVGRMNEVWRAYVDER